MYGPRSAVRRAYKIIQESSPIPNWPSPERPYVLVAKNAGAGSVWCQVIMSDVYMFPAYGNYQFGVGGYKREMHYLYVGVRSNTKFRKALPELLAWRDLSNLIYAHSQNKRRITEDDIRQMRPFPELITKLVEASCMAAIGGNNANS